MDNDQKKLLDQFRSITGIDEERGKFYLESAAWSLQVIWIFIKTKSLIV